VKEYTKPNLDKKANIRVSSVNALKKAIEEVKNGDIITIKNGTYKNFNVVLKTSGKKNYPHVDVRAETPGKVILTGKSGIALASPKLTLSGISFENLNYTGNDKFDDSKIEMCPMYLSDHNTVYNCRVQNIPDMKPGITYINSKGVYNAIISCSLLGKKNEGAMVKQDVSDKNKTTSLFVYKTIFYDIDPVYKASNWEALRIGNTEDNGVWAGCHVYENWFEKCSGEIEVISNKSCGNIYHKNMFLNCEGHLTIRWGEKCVIKENSFYNSIKSKKVGGIRVIGPKCKVMNNYLKNIRGQGGIILYRGVHDDFPSTKGYNTAHNTEVSNNILINCDPAYNLSAGGSSCKERPYDPYDCKFTNNVLYKGAVKADGCKTVTGIKNLESSGELWYDVNVDDKIEKEFKPVNKKPGEIKIIPHINKDDTGVSY